MQIQVLYSSLLKHMGVQSDAASFAREFALRSMSVEALEDLKEKFAGMILGEVKEIKEHPNANKLKIALTDIGGQVVEIVCGGANLAVGQLVAVAVPGARVRWHGEGDLITLGEAEIRGVKSFGMICAPSEIGFPNLPCGSHDIWVLNDITSAAPGTPLAAALELEDTMLDIEITSNRPDCMGIIGLAREGAASLQADFKDLSVKAIAPGAAELGAKIEAPKKCFRYSAVKLEGVKNGPSPWWLQKALLIAGERPINAIVDITNYVRLELAQPMHAFDAAKVAGDIVVREAAKGEQLKALDGKVYELKKGHLVIADANGALAIAGIMGGEESSVQLASTSVIFEAATFEPVNIRRSARDLNCYSASQLLYEKGLSAEAVPVALARAVELAAEICGARVSSIVADVYPKPEVSETYPVEYKRIRSRIGVEIADVEIDAMLTRLGFALAKVGNKTKATVPYWRAYDIENEIDLTEEVARLYGYHLMPRTLPSGALPDYDDDAEVTVERAVKRFFAAEGYTEFFGLAFVDGRDLARYDLSTDTALKIHNPLSEDLGYLRPSLMPGLLRDVARNETTTAGARVFELGRVYLPQAGELPLEDLSLVVAEYGKGDAGLMFRRLKGTLERFALAHGLGLRLAPLTGDVHWHPGRSASINLLTKDGTELTAGVLGAVSHEYRETFKVDSELFVLSLDLAALVPHLKRAQVYVPVPELPSVSRDVAYLAPETATYEDLAAAALAATPLVRSVDLVEIYRGASIPAGKKGVTLTFTLQALDKTLTAEEISAALDLVGTALVPLNVQTR